MKRLLPGLVVLAMCVVPLHTASAHTSPPGQQAPAPPIRYMDLTARSDGWGAAQLAATKASKDKQVIVVSYLDPQQTRALYDEAARFMAEWKQPRVVGVIRSPAAPANMSATPNPLQFDVFFDGSVIPPMEHPDPRFTRLEQLDAVLRGIHRTYFAATPAQDKGCFDIEHEPDPATGGLRIPRQRVCPTGKLPPP